MLNSGQKLMKWTVSSPVYTFKPDNGQVTKAAITLEPSVFSQFRKVNKIELIKDVTKDAVTVSIRTTAAARDNVFAEILRNYPGQIVEQNLDKSGNIKVPVLQVTVPYKDLGTLLTKVTQMEESFLQMPAQLIKDHIGVLDNSAITSSVSRMPSFR
jgi:hypothetical protein